MAFLLERNMQRYQSRIDQAMRTILIRLKFGGFVKLMLNPSCTQHYVNDPPPAGDALTT